MTMIVSKSIYDVIIIGAGPIGIACGLEAVRNNFNYLIIEKGFLVNSLYHYPTNMIFFSTSEKIELGGVPFVSHGIKPTRREALEYYRRVADAFKLNIKTYEKVLNIESIKEDYKITTDKEKYFTKNIVVASGYYDNPVMMNVPGENLQKVKHYFTEAHPYAYKKVAVIGAGNSAVDVALEVFRTCAEVTMIIREKKIKDSIKYWVKPDIENRIKEGSIKAYFNSEVVEIKEKEILISTKGKIISIGNDFVFAMTGYCPDYNFLKKTGIEFAKDGFPEFDRKTFQTSKRGIYLAGTVCSGRDTDKYFIENSIEHANVIMKAITQKK